jgi:hypothetical protein
MCGRVFNGRKRTWMDHVGAMFKGNFDDLITSKISSHWGVLATLANDICLIGLCLKVLVIRSKLRD